MVTQWERVHRGEKAGAKVMRWEHVGHVPGTIRGWCRRFIANKETDGKKDGRRNGVRKSTGPYRPWSG